MNTKDVVVRLVAPSTKAALPAMPTRPIRRYRDPVLEKGSNIFAGSCMGFLVGTLVYVLLKYSGVDCGGLETSLIIGLPSFLGTVTSLVVF